MCIYIDLQEGFVGSEKGFLMEINVCTCFYWEIAFTGDTGDRKRNYRVRECTCVRKKKCYKGVSGIDATGVGK